MTSKIGIIAGGGQFPLLFARAARQEGRQVVVVAHEGESRTDLAAVADKLYWIKLGQLGKIIRYLKMENVREAVFLGTITKTRIFRDIRPDWRGLSLWRKIDIRHDDSILRAIAGELEKEGILVRESTLYLKQLLFPRGVLTRKGPSASQMEDIRFGWQVARAIGNQDIGQCVVVRDRTVLAVEAIEGTDATIKRGGLLAGEQAVVVKVKKPNQDSRFDLPAIGLQTIATMQEAKAFLLAVETGQALLFDGEEVVRQADAAGITIVGIEELADGSLAF
jgi:UDP-2,3-diacylglucosamine hydrolase